MFGPTTWGNSTGSLRQRGNHFWDSEIARDTQHHVVGMVELLVELHQVGAGDCLDSRDRGKTAKRGAAVDGLCQFPVGHFLGVVILATDRLDALFAGQLHLVFPECGGRQHVGENGKGPIEVLGEGAHEDVPHIATDAGFNGGGHEFQLLVDFFRGERRCTATAHDCTDKPREPRLLGRLVDAPRTDVGSDVHLGKFVVFHEVHHHAVIEHRPFGLRDLEFQGGK